MSYDAILAATAIGSVLLALLGFWFENRRSRRFAGVNLVFELDRLFNSQEYCELRKQAASSFAGECHRGEEKALRAIVNFFEGIAYYVDRRLIDRRTVWYFFYYYLSRFCPLARPYIDQERRLDPTIWESFLRLCDQLDGIEAAKRRRIESSLVVSPQDLARFVNEELAL